MDRQQPFRASSGYSLESGPQEMHRTTSARSNKSKASQQEDNRFRGKQNPFFKALILCVCVVVIRLRPMEDY